MARLVWRYSDDAGAIIENVYKFCMEEKKSGMKLTESCMIGLQHSLPLPLRKLWKRRRRRRTSSNNQSNHRHLRRKCHWDVVRSTITSMYSLKKVLTTLDNTRTELKQSIDYTGSTGRLCKDLFHTKCAHTRCGVNQKVLMERQDVSLSRIRYLRMVRDLREAGYTDETDIHTSHAVPKCWQDSPTGLKIPFSKGNLRIVELYDPWVCTIITI